MKTTKIARRPMMAFAAVFIMALALCVTSVTAQAATKTRKLTMYVGEKFAYSYIGIGSLKSVKSSNKKIVTAKKSGSKNTMTAKKKGSATVTVKGSSGTYIYKVSVKAKPKFDVAVNPLPDGYVQVSLKNKSAVFADSVAVDVSFCDAAGNVLETDHAYFHYVGSKKTAYDKVYLLAKDVDFSKTQFTTDYSRNPDYKYKDYTKKVKFNVSLSGNSATITTKTSYKKSGSVYAAFGLVYKDAAGTVVGAYYDSYNYLYKTKKSDSTVITVPEGVASVELVGKRAFVKEYNNK